MASQITKITDTTGTMPAPVPEPVVVDMDALASALTAKQNEVAQLRAEAQSINDRADAMENGEVADLQAQIDAGHAAGLMTTAECQAQTDEQ